MGDKQIGVEWIVRRYFFLFVFAFFSALLAIVQMGMAQPAYPKKHETAGVEFACVELGQLVRIKLAEKAGKTKRIQSMLRGGCITTTPGIRVEVVDRYKNATKISVKAKDIGLDAGGAFSTDQQIDLWTTAYNVD